MKKLLVNMWSELKLRIWSNSKIISTKWLGKESFLQATQPFPAAKKPNINTWNSSLSLHTKLRMSLVPQSAVIEQNRRYWHHNRYWKRIKTLRSFLYRIITKEPNRSDRKCRMYLCFLTSKKTGNVKYKGNIVSPSPNVCCFGEAINITYSKCVSQPS